MSDINITISGKKRLLTAGKYCDKNIVITPVGGGDFSGEYVIPVDELPTENIDANAVYLCKGAYYKYANERGWTKYLAPTGTLTITENGTHDVTEYARVNVNVPTEGGTGGTCSGNHIIEVTELPTENIDESAVYECGGAYYKKVKEFTDAVMVSGGEAVKFTDMLQGAIYSFNTIPTQTTDGILVSDGQNAMHFYYIEDVNDVFVYFTDNGWTPLSVMDMGTYNGMISDISQATADGYYALMESGNRWEKYFTGTQVIEAETLPTENIDESAVYFVDGAYYKFVNELVGMILVEGDKRTLATVDGDDNLIKLVVCSTRPTDVVNSFFVYYYFEGIDDFFLYYDGWMSISLWGHTYGGTITDESEATADGYYAIRQPSWVNHSTHPVYNGEVVIE